MNQTNSIWTETYTKFTTVQSNTEDQLIELGHNLNQNPNNVLAYKRLKKNRLRTFQHSQTNLDPVSTLNQFSISSNQQISDEPKAKTQQMFRKFIAQKPKPIIKTSIVKRTHSGEKLTLENSQEKAKKRVSKSVNSHEKPLPRGDKYLMVWLNRILAGYYLGDPVQEGRLKALQKFNLDKNSLLSRGLKQQTIDKIYQTLFAHSMGFNSQLKEIVTNMSTLKLIWKVYAILLEYCSQGNFQTMIGQLQRDMRKNEERLIAQIEKRQKMIDNTDERMEQKLAKYQKQNKQLSKELQSLTERHNQLQSDFRQMEMAFNTEINLRIAYENIINRVYSTHERLNLAHNKLFRDFQQTDAVNKKIENESKNLKSKNIQLSVYYKEAIEEVQDLKKFIQNKQAMILGLKLNEQQLQEKIMKQALQKKDQILEIRDKDKKIYQLQQDIKSSNLIIEIMKGSSNSQLEEYKRLSEQNLYLRNLKQEHTQKIGALLTQINCLNGRESSIKADLQYANKKCDKLTAQLSQTKEQVANMINRVQNAEVQKDSIQLQMKQLITIIDSLRKGLKENKQRYEQLEKNSNKYQKYSSSLKDQFNKIHDDKLEFELKIKQIQNQKFQIELELNKRISEILTLKKSIETQQISFQHKYDKLYSIWGSQQTIGNKLEIELTKTKDQLEKAKIQIGRLTQIYSNMSFEQSKLQSNYRTNLLLFERQKQAQKQLLIQVSKFQQQNGSLYRQIASKEKFHKKQIRKMQVQKQRLMQVVKNQKEIIVSKQGYVHPMMSEDGLAHTIRAQQNYRKAKISFETEVQRIKENAFSVQMNLKKQQSDTRLHCKQIEKQMEKKVNQAQKQEQYFRQKCKELRTINLQLEMRLQYVEQAKANMDSKTENKMNELIKQKNKQIQELLTELEHTQDNFQKKQYFYETQIESVKNQSKQTIVNLTQQKEKLERQLIKLIQIQEEREKQLEQREKQLERQAEAIALSPKKNTQVQGEPRKIDHHPQRTEFINKLKITTLHYRK